MRHLKPLVAIALLGGCEAEPIAEPAPECTPISFRACVADGGCRGVQQCVEPGSWSVCACTVLDGSFPEKDVAQPDASDGQVSSDGAPVDAEDDSG